MNHVVAGTADRTSAPTPTRRRHDRRVGRQRRTGGVPWWFVAPALALYAFAALIPNAQAIFYSFTDWDGLSSSFSFVGFDNYREAFQSRPFVPAVTHTLVLTAMVVVLQLVIGLALALALHGRVKSRNALRVTFFAPVVVTSVAVSYTWKYIYAPTGSLNSFLELVGLDGWRRDWLGDPSVNLWAIAVMFVWQSVGVTMVIFLAGLQNIDPNVIEAAHLDRANARQRFWWVVRPLLAPAFYINAVLAVVGGLRMFDQIYITTRGGPAYTTATLATLAYTDGFILGEYSYGMTVSVTLAVLVGVIAVVQLRLMRLRSD